MDALASHGFHEKLYKLYSNPQFVMSCKLDFASCGVMKLFQSSSFPVLRLLSMFESASVEVVAAVS